MLKQNTWSAVFVDETHFAIPTAGIQLKDAAPGVKVGWSRSLSHPWQKAVIKHKNQQQIFSNQKSIEWTDFRINDGKHQSGLPPSLSLSSQSRSLREGALGRENNETGCSRGHNLATLFIIMHPRGTHSSERHTHTHLTTQSQLHQTVQDDDYGCCIKIYHLIWILP